MSGRHGIFRNSVALAAGNFAASALGLFFMALYARTHGPDGLGMFQFATAVASMTSLVVALGLDALLVREIAREGGNANALAAASLASKSALCLPALGIILMLAAARYGGVQGQLLLVVAAAALLDVLTATITAVFRGFERMDCEAVVIITGSAVSAIAGAAALAAGRDIVTVVSCWSLGSVFKAIVAFLLARGRFLSGRFVTSAGVMAGLAGPSIACGALALIGAVYSNADVVLLRELASQREVGWYTAATRLTTVVLYLPSLLTASLFPVLSRQASSPGGLLAARASYDRAFYALLLLGLPAGAGLPLVARPLVRLVYGAGFEPAAAALSLLAPYLGWFFVNLVNGTAMIALGRQNLLAVGTGVATLFSVAANLVVIPRFGVPGACLVTVAASGAGAVLYTVVCHRAVGLRFRWSLAGKGAACAVVMAVCVSGLMDLGAHFLAAAAAGALIYGMGLVVSGLLPGGLMPWMRPSPSSAEGA